MSVGVEAATIEAILRGEFADPFAVLGMHNGPSGSIEVRTFQPHASAVEVLDRKSGKRCGSLERLHEGGFFAGEVSRRRRFPYRLRVEWPNGTVELDDPYDFPPVLGSLDAHLIVQGMHERLHEVLGAQPRTLAGTEGVSFAVWAPNARRVSVVGHFNGWDGRRHVMRLRRECGVWEIFIPGLGPGEIYKYEVIGQGGERLPLKADPLARRQEMPPATASIVHRAAVPPPDEAWIAARQRNSLRDAPIAIYEAHLPSWRRDEENRYLSYAELADQLVPYAKDMGFTHLQLLPVSEFPFDGSWGYQPISLFAPTSRHGTPEDFRGFVDRCHREGLGVLIDWVPGHFPTDPHGLALFDGTHLYEHADPRRGRHMDWDTLIYNYGRTEVMNFLLVNALFWLEHFAVDGLRVDAVASMLYLDYSRQPGEWVPNEFGGNENLEAIRFLRLLNERVYGSVPGAMTVAEESTAWPMVSRPTYVGGLGFGYKWNMGWMHDTLSYMRHDPVHRRFHHDLLTFGLIYAFNENFVLPLSHDEVVHEKGSLIGKMPGDRWQRFANLRAYFGFMYTHPGKKLLFMGGEFAQEREWNHDRSLDWHLLDDALHAGVQRLVRDLNRLYRERPALHQLDCEPEGFEWIDASDTEQSVLSYLRWARGRRGCVMVVCNFTPTVRHGYRIGVPVGGHWREVMNSDADFYGGSNVGNGGGVAATPEPCHGRPHSLLVTLPPLAALVFEPEEIPA